jgi:anti-sigma factor RsiW
VTTCCREFEVLLAIRAATALEPAEATRLEVHLAGCPVCRAEAQQLDHVIDLARLPPMPLEQRSSLRDLARDVRAGLDRGHRRRRNVRRFAAGLAVVAAAAALMIVPGRVSHREAPPVVNVASAWQEPDIDALWEATDVLEVTQSDPELGSGSAAAHAAIEADES